MDKRLELTREQKNIMERYENILKEMDDANIKCVYRSWGELVAINGEQVDELLFDEDLPDDVTDNARVDFDDAYPTDCPTSIDLTCTEHYFRVTFK